MKPTQTYFNANTKKTLSRDRIRAITMRIYFFPLFYVLDLSLLLIRLIVAAIGTVFALITELFERLYYNLSRKSLDSSEFDKFIHPLREVKRLYALRQDFKPVEEQTATQQQSIMFD